MGLFCVVLVLCSWISVPFGVPFTLQLLGVFLSIGFLGGKKASLCVLAYLLLGCIGLPVFAGFQGGVGVFAGPTGGYLLGLLPCCLVGGAFYQKATSWLLKGLSFLVALLVVYGLGAAWYCLGYAPHTMSLWEGLGLCVLPFVLPDLLKIGVSLLLLQRMGRRLREPMV